MNQSRLKSKTKSHTSRMAANNTPVALIAEQRQSSHKQHSRAITHALLSHLESFAGHKPLVSEITPRFCSRFAKHLLRKVKTESARTYLQKLHAILSLCVQMHLIPVNPLTDIHTLLPQRQYSERIFLTANEIQQLSLAECPAESTKQAFLFACYTGLRISDIETLLWKHIHVEPAGTFIVKSQFKTNRTVRIPLCRQALDILNQIPRSRNPHVFRLRSRTSIANDLKTWTLNAAINKHITFHTSRHSFASLLVFNAVDILTISRLCGHASTRTTEIYTHIADARLKAGVQTIESLFDSY